MSKTNFSQDWGGKIFPDYFETVRLRNDDKFFIGNVHDIMLDAVHLGEAKIVALKPIRLEGIRDNISFPTAGMPAARFCGWLKNTYNDQVQGGVKPSTEFVHLVFQWQNRNYAAHAGYMAKFMQKRLIEYRQALVN